MAAIGTADCLACSRSLIVKSTGKGGLNLSCPHCDLSCYAKANTEAVKKLAPRVKLYAVEPAPKPAGGDAPKPPAAAPAASRAKLIHER